jgi:hypothetical protein
VPDLEGRLVTTRSDDTCVLYLGRWQATELAERSCHSSNVQYNACLFIFRGPVVRWIGPTSNDQGFADVYVDEELQCSVDGFSETSRPGAIRFERSDLPADAIHTLKIVVRKVRQPRATDCFQHIESFQSVEPVDYCARITAAKNAEYAQIHAGTKPFAPEDAWNPVVPRARAPRDGVTLDDGLLFEMFRRNIDYLTASFALPHYCDPDHPSPSDGGPGWSQWLPASNEGRLLAGAAHSLRWEERDDLRAIVTTIVDAIADRMREDGYFNYYPEDSSYTELTGPHSERKNYDRVFWTRGLLAAGMSGERRAHDLLRRMYDWFNASPYLPTMLDGFNATNGLPGGPLMHLSPVGTASDLIVAERYYDQEYWMQALRNREPLSFSHYPGDRPHCYDLLGLEAFVDEYTATGDEKYLAAARGGWEVFRDSYKHVGGTVAICEHDGPYWPKSYYITTGHTGETCGSVFWIMVNSKLLNLSPMHEAYASEIEESLLNVIASAQAPGGIRYHNRLHGQKERGRRGNTCCEVSAAGLIGRLPELVFSIDAEGVYVNLFAASSMRATLAAGEVSLRMATTFPCDQAVEIEVATRTEVPFPIRLRIPGWAASDVVVQIDGEDEVVGSPGTYVEVIRNWSAGAVLRFTLPMTFSATLYTGLDEVEGNDDRYALKYGPVLLALCGDSSGPGDVPRIASSAADLPQLLEPVPERALQFTVRGHPGHRYIPYWMVDQELFTCFPVVQAG